MPAMRSGATRGGPPGRRAAFIVATTRSGDSRCTPSEANGAVAHASPTTHHSRTGRRQALRASGTIIGSHNQAFVEKGSEQVADVLAQHVGRRVVFLDERVD